MRKFLIGLFAIAAFLLNITPVFGQARVSTQASSAVLTSKAVQEDNREAVLAAFLKKNKSPLVPYAGEFVAAADAYGLDWKLVVAITGVESTFGKRIPYNSFNAYGWNNGGFKFASWEQSIWHVTSKLKTKYVDRGAVTVYQIGRIYAPPSPTWASRVASIMNKIEAAQGSTLDL